MVDNFGVECGEERWCEMWRITVMLECGGERLMWNVVRNGDVEYGG